ncbi:MAG: hypothetical protein KGZ69_13555 [Methylomonas sp.]|nr:hypothetical protein [Methylomonas sp.]
MTDRVSDVAQILLGIAAGAPINTCLVTPSENDTKSARKIVLMTIRTPVYSSLEAEEKLGFIESRLRICLTGNKTVSAWATRVLGMRDGLPRLAGYLTQAYQAPTAATIS